MLTLYILRGLPGSGKSTLARKLMNENPDESIVRVSKELLREMCHFGRNPEHRDIINRLKDTCIKEALYQGYSVISDDTNLRESDISRLRHIAQQQNAVVVLHVMDTPLEECIERDSKRPAPVGEEVIRRMYQESLAK